MAFVETLYLWDRLKTGQRGNWSNLPPNVSFLHSKPVTVELRLWDFQILAGGMSPKRSYNNKQHAFRRLARQIIEEECWVFSFQRQDKVSRRDGAWSKAAPSDGSRARSRRGPGCRWGFTSALHQPTHILTALLFQICRNAFSLGQSYN